MDAPAASEGSATFVPSLEDALVAYRLKMRPRLWAVLLGAFVVAVFIAILNSISNTPPKVLFGAIPVAVGVYGLLLVLNRRFLLPWWVRRIYRQQVGLRKEVTLAWSDEGLQATSDSGASRMAWSDYAGRRENDEVLLLYHSDVLFQFVPRRALTDDQHASLARCAAAVPLKR